MQKYASFSHGSPVTRLKIAMYYAHRTVTSRTLRKWANRTLVGALSAIHGRDVDSHSKSSFAVRMQASGYVELGKMLSREQCRDILRYLNDKTMFDVRGSGKAFKIGDVPEDVKLGDYPLETIVDCPHVLDIANDPGVIKLMGHYLGFKPTIVSLGLRWSFPSDSSTDTVQRFHRDSEPGSAKVLIYLTDVDHAAGPHAYVEGTHRERMPIRLRPYSDDEIERKYGTGVIIKGVAGTGFAIDTRGIHRGTPPTERPRLILGIQYALLPCFLYEYSPVKCRRAEELDRYTNRLMITWGEPNQGQKEKGLPRDKSSSGLTA